MLDLPADIERTVRAYAAREGVSIPELIARAFPPLPDKTVAADPMVSVRSLLAQWQQLDGTPSATPVPNDGSLTPSEALFRQWAQEDANLTEAEHQIEEARWQAFREGINAERAMAGMRLLF